MSFASFIIGLIICLKLRKQSKKLNLLQLDRFFTIAIFYLIALLSIEIISKIDSFKWVFHASLLALLIFCIVQKVFEKQNMLILAVAPVIILSFLGDLLETFRETFYKEWENSIDNIPGFAFIWMIAILIVLNRQNKAAEQDRIIRLHEAEINKAIAIRKEELEILVLERTSEIMKQKTELEESLNSLQKTQNQLIQSEKMASLGELTAGIAHEIQNPLNFVNNFSELNKEMIEEMLEEIEKGNLAEIKSIAKTIEENEEKIMFHGKRADSIVKGMLQHSRSSSAVKEPSDINALADEYLRLSYHGLRAKDKSFNALLKTDFDSTIEKINIIPQDIGRVILNLLTNAFYAVSEKKKKLEQNATAINNYEPTVSVSTKKVGDKVEIRVIDNGNGIPQKVLDKIFQPFFTTKPTGKGTGLGLSMSYDIVKKGHGGELKVETIDQERTTFIIQLPLI